MHYDNYTLMKSFAPIPADGEEARWSLLPPPPKKPTSALGFRPRCLTLQVDSSAADSRRRRQPDFNAASRKRFGGA